MGCSATKQGPSKADKESFPAVRKGETYIVTLTKKQKKALAEAATAQEKVAAAADAATAEEKAKNGNAYTGLRPLEPLLASIDLIDAAYLIALGEAGGVVPRWQDVPAAARINAASVWRLRRYDGVPILVLSYPWLDRHHPDKHGATLRRILPILRACREQALNSGVHCTFGVFWDYMSLPQGTWVCGRNGEKRFEDDRTEAEGARFKQGLKEMADFYVHPFTHVLSARTPIPDGDYENKRPYEKRGCAAPRRRPASPCTRRTRPARLRWCHFELRTASIVKSSNCLWDLSLHKEGTAITFDECYQTLKSTRPPLTSPEQMARELREKKFTNDADIGVVASLYEQGFVRAFDTFRQYDSGGWVDYAGLGWGTAQVPTLVAALEYAEAHCRPKDAQGKEDATVRLDFFGNEFTNAEKGQLQATITNAVFGAQGSTKFVLFLG